MGNDAINTFSSPCPDIDDERHLAQSPVEERPRDQQTVAKISMGPRCLPQTSLMFDLRFEERIRHDMPVRGVRAELRRHEASDAGGERGFEEGLLCLHCGRYVSQARYHGVLVS